MAEPSTKKAKTDHEVARCTCGTQYVTDAKFCHECGAKRCKDTPQSPRTPGTPGSEDYETPIAIVIPPVPQHLHLGFIKLGSAIAGCFGIFAGYLFLASWGVFDSENSVRLEDMNLLYNKFIPGLAFVALLMTLVLGVRAVIVLAGEEKRCQRMDASRRSLLEKFGHKCVVASSASILFVLSCFYRAVNIADEGAFTCRGKPTIFNAPASGRFVATIGEVALVVQIAYYIDMSASRLNARQGLWSKAFQRWTSVPFTTLAPVLIAETMSWCGVLSAIPKFFCVEYVLWCVISLTWIWDGAGLLYQSRSLKDQVVHAGLVIAGLLLFSFNAFFEIPHFFKFDAAEEEGKENHNEMVSIFECIKDENSPLWMKRLPFFVCYFIGCSWCCMALQYRFLRMIPKPSHKHQA